MSIACITGDWAAAKRISAKLVLALGASAANNGWAAEDHESLTRLQRSFELGVNLVDTALAYGDGHSERLVGQALKNSFSRGLYRDEDSADERHLAGQLRLPPLSRYSLTIT